MRWNFRHFYNTQDFFWRVLTLKISRTILLCILNVEFNAINCSPLSHFILPQCSIYFENHYYWHVSCIFSLKFRICEPPSPPFTAVRPGISLSLTAHVYGSIILPHSFIFLRISLIFSIFPANFFRFFSYFLHIFCYTIGKFIIRERTLT